MTSKKVCGIFFWGGMFLTLYIFFTKIHPLIIFDTDDWTYISTTRDAFPIAEWWNPARILPEILMPLCAYIGATLIYPVTGDYIMSLAYIFAFVLCVIIELYVYLFHSVLKKLHCDANIALLIAGFFLMMHFLVFRSMPKNNVYALYANDVTCYFYYTIPTLANIALLFLLELYPEYCKFYSTFTSKELLQRGLLLLALYLAVFSNLFCSYLIAIWAGLKILGTLVFNIKNGRALLENIKEQFFYILVVVLWLISALYELNGGRAQSLKGQSYGFALAEVFAAAVNVCKKTNGIFVMIMAGTILFILLVALTAKSKIIREVSSLQKQIAVFECLAVMYVILLCAKTVPEYITRPEIILGPVIVLIFEICILMAILVKCFPKISIFLPLLGCIVFFDINVTNRTFLDSNIRRIDWKIAYQLDNDIIQQIKDADAERKTEVQLYVPKYSSDDNWPQAVYAASKFSQSLYKHGIISNEIQIILVPDKNMNCKYGIPE